MRFFIRLAVVLTIIAVLAAGLLPPVFDRGRLDTDTLNAARAASAVVQTSGGQSAATAAARASIAKDPGVTLDSVTFSTESSNAFVTVRASEDVHTFMDGFPGLKSWFHLTSTQESQFGQ
ncbi:MAG TPA: hypothetical protein DCQ30_12440 [Acidimicrobiaceae bacterium]|nr:hypothetical protein [Acidimicrobiaceae bacterium]